jgi:hypothetical protein
MHLPTDKVNITWGQLEEMLDDLPDGDFVLKSIEHVDVINSCYSSLEKVCDGANIV